ncbi:MAG TPA: hypothetical protein VFK05_20450 [Polyangiaceae bacterium]|nr:hypothetical protein [Polyangiaceae bacterium]
MRSAERRSNERRALGALLSSCACALVFACAGAPAGKLASSASGPTECDPNATIAFSHVQTIVSKRCTSCHSSTGEAGPDYDWTNAASLSAHRRNVAAQVAQGSMPPVGTPRLNTEERRTLVCWGRAQGQ